MGSKAERFYAVINGRNPGIYKDWYGDDGAEAQVKGFPNARFKGFITLKDAKDWFKTFDSDTQNHDKLEKTDRNAGNFKKQKSGKDCPEKDRGEKKQKRANEVILYTDGGCRRNPGPGGYGVILKYNDYIKEASGGFRLTTNNRMELMGCIVGLGLLKSSHPVTIYTDSKYVVNGINKGWAKRWRAYGWMRNRFEPAENADLWERLLDLCEINKANFKWIKGHSGHPENERCDQLVKKITMRRDLPPDNAYESGSTYVHKP